MSSKTNARLQAMRVSILDVYDCTPEKLRSGRPYFGNGLKIPLPDGTSTSPTNLSLALYCGYTTMQEIETHQQLLGGSASLQFKRWELGMLAGFTRTVLDPVRAHLSHLIVGERTEEKVKNPDKLTLYASSFFDHHEKDAPTRLVELEKASTLKLLPDTFIIGMRYGYSEDELRALAPAKMLEILIRLRYHLIESDDEVFNVLFHWAEYTPPTLLARVGEAIRTDRFRRCLNSQLVEKVLTGKNINQLK